MWPTLIIVGILVLLVIYAISQYNALVSLRRQCENAFAQIDVQLKRRYELIPNLVETVKGYMKYEQETLDKVITARNLAMGARSVGDRAAAEGQLTTALNGLFAIAESYPELKASDNMLSLQEELKHTENKVAFARQYFNDIVTAYNTKIETFPSSIFANMGNFKPRELFEIDDPTHREAVKVSF
jgi:LemA protein